MEGVVIAFVFGLIFGSFLNVVIARWDDWESIVRDRSHCPNCKTRLAWHDLIPLLSFLTLRGHCRYCQKPISYQYPLVELSTAALIAAGYYLIFLTTDLPLTQSVFAMIGYVLAIGSIVAIFYHDLYEMMIPEVMSYVLLVGAAIFSLFFFHDWSTTLYGGLAGLLPIALLVYPSRGAWMGEGDVKLSAGLGMLVGWPATVVYLILAFMLGGVTGSYLLLSKKVRLKSAVPFAPFLIIGALIALYLGSELVQWYLGLLGYAY